MATTLTKEILEKELADLSARARASAEKLDQAKILFQKYQGAVEAIRSLLSAYFPEEKANEPSSMGEKPTVA